MNIINELELSDDIYIGKEFNGNESNVIKKDKYMSKGILVLKFNQ